MFKMILSAVVALGMGSVAYATGAATGQTVEPTKTDAPAATDAATTGETMKKDAKMADGKHEHGKKAKKPKAH